MSDVRNKLYALVQKGESSEVEFKSARGGFPGSFWESYSAFANTNGGTIILAYKKKAKSSYWIDYRRILPINTKRIFGTVRTIVTK